MHRIATILGLMLIVVMAGCAAYDFGRPDRDRVIDASKATHPEAVVDVAPTPPDVLVDQAIELITDAKYTDAMTILEEVASSEDPAQNVTTAEATLWLGYCYEQQGNAARAQSVYQGIVKKWPGTLAAATARDLLTPP